MTKKIIFWNLKNSPNSGKPQYEEGIGTHKLSTIVKVFGYDTVIYQDDQFGASPEKIKEVTQSSLVSGENILAYSLMSNGLPLLEQLAQTTPKEIPVLLGGPGASLEPEKCLQYFSRHPKVALVQGEAEGILEQLLSRKPEEWIDVPKVWSHGRNGTYHYCSDLSQSPFADLSASARRADAETKAKNEELSSRERFEALKSLTISQIESRRGCYYRCEFCGNSGLPHQRVRTSSPKRLVAEMEHMFKEYGITFFSLTDNVAFDEVEWWKEFAELMKSSPITRYTQFGGYSCPKMINTPEWKAFLPELYSVGLRGIILGVQAGSSRVLREIIHRSPDDPQNAIQFTKYAVSLGINVKVDFILGHPTETLDELEDTSMTMSIIQKEGGEVFVRQLKVVPHSGYAQKLAAGEYVLPGSEPEYNETLEEISAQEYDDGVYLGKTVRGNMIPNKYLIDREWGIIYPSTIFSWDELRLASRNLQHTDLPDLIKSSYALMFELAMKMKEEKYN